MNDLITKEVYEQIEKWTVGYCNKRGITDYDEQQDMLGEAHDAAVKAALTYKGDRGTAFTTWLFRIMEGAFSDYGKERKGELISLPEKRGALWAKAQQTREQLLQWLGRSPSPAEIAQALQISVQEYFKLRDECEILEPESLDDELETDEDDAEAVLADIIADEVDGPEEILMQEQESVTLWEAVSGLTEQEQAVIEGLYYGTDGVGFSQAEVAKALGVSQKTVSNVHEQALQKLRRRGIAGFLGR